MQTLHYQLYVVTKPFLLEGKENSSWKHDAPIATIHQIRWFVDVNFRLFLGTKLVMQIMMLIEYSVQYRWAFFGVFLWI